MTSYDKYSVNKPYPKVYIDDASFYYASLLSDDYAGIVSEYTAVSQYVYDHIMSQNKHIADAFIGIAIVEMKHLELLGDTILKLGANPIFTDADGFAWSSSFVPYGTTTTSRLQLAIQSEFRAISEYRNHIASIGNNSIKDLLYRIIEDETLHIKIFEGLLEKNSCN